MEQQLVKGGNKNLVIGGYVVPDPAEQIADGSESLVTKLVLDLHAFATHKMPFAQSAYAIYREGAIAAAKTGNRAISSSFQVVELASGGAISSTFSKDKSISINIILDNM